MNKLYTCLDNDHNGIRNHTINGGKLHIFEVYKKNDKYYAEKKSLCGDITLNSDINIKLSDIFTEPQIKVKQFSSESAKNKSYTLPTDTCKRCRGFCE